MLIVMEIAAPINLLLSASEMDKHNLTLELK